MTGRTSANSQATEQRVIEFHLAGPPGRVIASAGTRSPAPSATGSPAWDAPTPLRHDEDRIDAADRRSGLRLALEHRLGVVGTQLEYPRIEVENEVGNAVAVDVL